MILSILTYFRLIFRLILIVILAISFLFTALILHLLSKDIITRRRRFVQLNHFYAQLFIAALNVKINLNNFKIVGQGNHLVVCNHLGFVDIFCLAKIIPSCFITSQEMRETPVLGLITEMGGCIYVERRNRFKMLNEIVNITQTLKEGFNVLLYPEAQSHNGELVLPFKRNLIMAAAHAGVPILPVVFNIKNIDGESFSRANRDAVCWYGKMSFLTSLVNFCKTKIIEVDIEFLQPLQIFPSDDKALIAETLHGIISRRFRKISECSNEKGPSIQNDPFLEQSNSNSFNS